MHCGFTLRLFGILLIAAEAESVSYSNAINDGAWEIQSSVFECRLEHQIPYYGSAIFSTRAGESSRFYLKALSSRFQAGSAKMISKAPVWKRPDDGIMMDNVTVKRGKRPLWLNSKNTEMMLSELNKGREIAFQNKTWYGKDDDNAMQLVVGSIGFRDKYNQYLGCLSGLLSANFDQLKRTALYFKPGPLKNSDKLGSDITRKLDKVLMLVKHDKSIKRFYVDGHTSSPGDRTENLEISKMRAERVAEYLKLRGIPEDAIVTRWHGERYPAASNQTSAGRAKNRRVTLRLERVDEMSKMPMAAK